VYLIPAADPLLLIPLVEALDAAASNEDDANEDPTTAAVVDEPGVGVVPAFSVVVPVTSLFDEVTAVCVSPGSVVGEADSENKLETNAGGPSE